MSRKQKNRVGVIGLGQIGSKVSAGLRSAGFSVYVWNRSPRAEPNFLGSAVEVVDLCDTIQLFVPDDAALDKVIRTITAALRPRHVILAHPTIAPATAIELGAIVESTGARYVDAPFAGSRAEAANRQLVYYLGGSESAIKDARPVLQATSRSIVPVGAVGDAARLKLSLQILAALTLEGLSEMLALARAGGLKPEALLDALDEDPARSPFISEKLAAMVKGNFEGGNPVRHLYRDLQLALKLAGPNPAVPATGTVAGLLFGAMKRGWGTSDAAILSRAFEPDPPPAEIAKRDPIPAESAPPAGAVDAPVDVVESMEAVAAKTVAIESVAAVAAVNAVEMAPEPAGGAPKKPDAPPATRVLPELSDAPARSGMIPETHGGRGAIKPRRGLELIHTTPVQSGPPKPSTAPVRLPSLSPVRPATGTTPPLPPARPPTTVIPSSSPVRPATSPISSIPPIPPIPPLSPRPSARPAPAPIPAHLSSRPATTRIPPPAPARPAPTGAVPLPPFPAAPPVSPNFPTGTPHRIVRRLSDTTTNLQALLQSPLGGAKTGPTPIKAPAEPVTPVQPKSIVPSIPESEAPAPEGLPDPVLDAKFANALDAIDAAMSDEVPAAPRETVIIKPGSEVLEAIVAEILPPVVDPVIPGDIRPTQRVGLRPVGSGDNPPRSRLIREQKPKGWLKRLIGD